MEEVFTIGRGAGCGVHVSHFNCLADQALPVLDAARASGVDVTYDLYCYLYGSTIVGMVTLPPEVLEGGIEATVERLKRPDGAQGAGSRVRQPAVPDRDDPAGDAAAPGLEALRGQAPRRTRRRRRGKALVDFVCDLLIATELAAGCVVRHFAERQESDIRA